MRGTQNCSWLKVGAIGETCGKRCMGCFVSYIVTECAGVAFYQNQVENAGEPHSPNRSCTSCGATVAKINMRRTEKKAHKFLQAGFGRVGKKYNAAMNNFILEKNVRICIPVMHRQYLLLMNYP